MSLAEDSAARLRDLEREDLLRRPPTLHTKLGRSVCIDGQTFLCFSSNDYLGLASPALDAETLLQSSAEASLGSGGSRLILAARLPCQGGVCYRILVGCQSPFTRLFDLAVAARTNEAKFLYPVAQHVPRQP